MNWGLYAVCLWAGLVGGWLSASPAVCALGEQIGWWFARRAMARLEREQRLASLLTSMQVQPPSASSLSFGLWQPPVYRKPPGSL